MFDSGFGAESELVTIVSEAISNRAASSASGARHWPAKLALLLFVALGTLPFCYFVGVEYISAQQLGELTGDSAEEITDEDSSAAGDSTEPGSNDPLYRPVRNLSFGVGEELFFDINYGFINAGSAQMRVLDIVEWAGRPCYYIQTQAHSNSFFSSIFPVNDTVETIVDAVGLYSWHFEKRLREGSYASDRVYTFDQLNNLAFYENDTLPAPKFVQDVLSSFYYVRTLDLKIGETVTVDNFSRGKHAPLEVKVLRKETVETKAGEFDCIVVEPLLQAAGVFRHEGKLTVWLTDDKLKMPVQMKSKVLVGAISATLTDFKLGEIESF